MKNSLFRFVLLAASTFQFSCAFLSHETGFSVNESTGKIGPRVTEVLYYWGEQNASHYQIDNYFVLLYADSYDSSLLSLGVCPLPIIPTLGIFDPAEKEKLKIFMRFWKTPSAVPDDIQLLKAELKIHDSHYSPEKIRIINIVPGKKSYNTANETSTLPIALAQADPFEAEFQYPINPQLVDDFFLDIRVVHSHAATFKDTIHFAHTDYYLYGCIP